jgi:hypothetical protein
MPNVGFRNVPEEFQAGGDFREKGIAKRIRDLWKATFCRVAPFLFSQYIAIMLWRVRNSRGRPFRACRFHSSVPANRRQAASVRRWLDARAEA